MTTYCTTADVNVKLKGTTSANDTQIEANRDEAYAYMNDQIGLHASTPISPIPDTLKFAEANIAAGIFTEEGLEPVEDLPEKSLFRTKGEESLKNWISITYLGSTSGHAPPRIIATVSDNARDIDVTEE